MKYVNYYLFLFVILCLTVNCSSKVKEINTNVGKGTTISINKKEGIKVPKFQGYNSTIMPYYLTTNYDSLFPIIKEFSPQLLRFPGGTIANFYHPEGAGYGMSLETVDKMKSFNMGSMIVNQSKRVKDEKISVNYKVPFARLCKDLNSSVILVVNMLDGTVGEALALIDYFKSQKIKIAGVELGNEFYLKAYKDKFPTVESYIQKSKEFAKAIREKHPELKLAAIAAPSKNTKQVSLKRELYYGEWNKALASEKYYDAIIIHLYVKSKECIKNENIDELFDCVGKRVNSYADQTLEKIIGYHKSTFGKSTKIWITEWNLRETKTHFGNTFVQASYALDFSLNLAKINAQNNAPVEYSIYHNFCAGGLAFGLINPTTEEEKINNKQFIRRTAYYSLFMVEKVLNIKDIVYIPLNNVSLPKQLDLGVFYSKSKNQVYIFLGNKSDQELPVMNFNIDQLQVKNAILSQLKSDGLASAIGRVNYKKGAKNGQVDFLTQKIDLQSWTIPAHTLNRITVDLSE